MKMKVINLTIGKNPPVLRMTPLSHKTVCYRIENDCLCRDKTNQEFVKQVADETLPDVYPDVKKQHPRPFLFVIADRIMPDHYYGKEVSQCTARYHIYNDFSYDDIGDVLIENKRFKVTIPPLEYGYYYLDVFYKDGSNRIMINVV